MTICRIVWGKRGSFCLRGMDFRERISRAGNLVTTTRISQRESIWIISRLLIRGRWQRSSRHNWYPTSPTPASISRTPFLRTQNCGTTCRRSRTNLFFWGSRAIYCRWRGATAGIRTCSSVSSETTTWLHTLLPPPPTSLPPTKTTSRHPSNHFSRTKCLKKTYSVILEK